MKPNPFFSATSIFIYSLLLVSVAINIGTLVKIQSLIKPPKLLTADSYGVRSDTIRDSSGNVIYISLPVCTCADYMCMSTDGSRNQITKVSGPVWAITADSSRAYRKAFHSLWRAGAGPSYTIQLSRIDSDFFISKEVLNRTLNNTFNGIYVHLGYDATRTHLVFLLEPGNNSGYIPIIPNWITPDISQIYEDHVMCPPQCDTY